MTTYNVSNTSQLDAALTSAVGGDIILLASGTYTKLTKSTNVSKSSEVIIRSANKNNPAKFNDQGIDLTGANNITLDWIDFVGTAFDTGSNGITYPTTSEPVRFEASSNCKVRNCKFDFYLNGLRFHSCLTGMTVEYTDFTQFCVDPIQVYGSCDAVTLRRVALYNWRIDPARRSVDVRHPDGCHMRVNTSQVGTNPMDNVLIEDCLVDDPSGYAKAFFLAAQADATGNCFNNLTVRDCDIRIGRWSGISFEYALTVNITGNRMRLYDAGVKEKPTVAPWGTCSGTISNNVTPRAFWYQSGASASMFTLSGNVVSTTADPTGFVELVPGVNVGRGTDPDEDALPDAPTDPTTEWSDPPTNTTSKDGRFATYVEVAEAPGTYAAVLIIPAASVAFAAASTNSTVPGTPVTNLRWTDGTNSGGFRVANPATNAAGSLRYEQTGYAVAAGGVMSGLTWGYSVNSIWSAYTTYTGGFTAPGTPPVDTELPALADAEWSVQSTGVEVLPGRFAPSVIVTITYSGLQWSLGDGVWRGLVQIGTDSGDPIMQLLPQEQGGTEHTVQYAEAMSIRLRYSTGGEFSPQSVSAKAFTGPAAPGPIEPYEVGEYLTVDGSKIALAGFLFAIPPANRPGKVPFEGLSITRDDDEVTVEFLGALPPGAIGHCVLYAGEMHLAADGLVTFDAVTGKRHCIARAFDAAGVSGPGQHLRIPT